jgi:RNA-directed DNA polymerase
MRNRKKQEVRDVLNIFSIKHLALQLGTTKEEIISLNESIKDHFKAERREFKKKDGTIKVRIFYHPSKRLKKLLKAIDTFLLKKIKLPDSVHGARKGCSNVTNANQHVGKQFVFNTDIENFFPTIKPYNVYQLFIRLKCSHEVARVLARLCTADNHVPQGYNTSSTIANLVLSPVMRRIENLFKKRGLKPTSLVDDVTVSGDRDADIFIKTIEKIIKEAGFKVKPGKTHSFHRSRQQKVTGIVVNEKLNIDKDYFKELRVHLHICKKFGPTKLLNRGVINRRKEKIETLYALKSNLRGRLSYIKNINPIKEEKLLNTFKTINWNN